MSLDGLSVALYGASGIVAGTLYFVCLWWNARLFARGGSWLSILMLVGRMAALAGALTLAARQGTMPLLMMALGVFIARFAVMRGLRAASP